jgi:cell division protein FtsZ
VPQPDVEPASYEQTVYADPNALRPQPQQRPQQPPRPTQRPVEPRIPGRSATLFAEPPPAQPPAPAPRTSLFGRVTGAFRGHQPDAQPLAAPAPPAYRAEPAQEFRAEPPRASVRQASGEEGGIDIPAFLRRQSS